MDDHNLSLINGEDSHSSSSTPSYVIKKERNRYLIILPSQERTHVLVELLPDGSIRLPALPACSFYHLRASVRSLEESAESFLGINVRFVRELWATHEQGDYIIWGEAFETVAVLLFEWAEGENSAENDRAMKWMSKSEVMRANWVETEKQLKLDLKEVVSKTMEEISGEVHVRISPWRRLGWLTRMLTWVKAVTKCEIGDQELYGKFLKIVDHHHSVVWACDMDLSRMKCANVSDGELEHVYIKAALPLFGEARKTATIAKVLEECQVVPDVIAANEKECILMMRNAGNAQCEEADGKMLVETIVKMQKLAQSRVDELKAGGLEVRDSEWFLCNIHRLLYHESLDRAMKGSDEGESILRNVRNREDELKEAGKKISSFDVPSTLVHGDLTKGNMGSRKTLKGKGYQVFDWGMCHIGHPFIDLDVLQDVFQDDATCIKRWRMEYWKYWKSKVSEEEFFKLLRLVQLLVEAAGLDLFLREAEFLGEGEEVVSERLRHYVEFIRNTLNNIKDWNEEEARARDSVD
ncbi:unnamed protein product [Agarophyton chilense]